MSRGIYCVVCDQYIYPEDTCKAGCTPELRASIYGIRERAGDEVLKLALEAMTIRAINAERLVKLHERRWGNIHQKIKSLDTSLQQDIADSEYSW